MALLTKYSHVHTSNLIEVHKWYFLYDLAPMFPFVILLL
jgi:hypothetical protein